jgi:Ca-activated chloride channel homolog
MTTNQEMGDTIASSKTHQNHFWYKMKGSSMNNSHITHKYRMTTAALAVATTVLTASGGLFSSTPNTPVITCRVESERTVLTADKPESMMVKVSLKGAERAILDGERSPVNMALVIDRSGSMSGERIAQAKEGAITAVKRLTASDYLSIVIFDDKIETLIPTQRVTDKEAIISRIREITAGGSTAIFGGVSQAAAEVRKNSERGFINRIVLLSDGQANVGPQSPADLGRLGVSLMKEKISVTTIGVGLGYNEDLMTRLAAKSDGNSYFVENNNDLPRIFTSELGNVLSVVAKSVKVVVRFSSGATPVEIVGREGTIDGNCVSLDFNQIYSAQEKYVLIRTECAPGKSGETRDLAKVDVHFHDVAANTSKKVAALGSIRFSEDALAVRESVKKEVVREAALNDNATMVAKAIVLADQGKKEEAAQILEKQAAKLKQQAADYGIDELQQEADYQTFNATNVKKSGFDARSRKENVQRNFDLQNQMLKQ